MSKVPSIDIPAEFIPRTLPDIAALILAGVLSTAYLLKGYAWHKPDPYHHLWFQKPTEKYSKLQTLATASTRNIADKLEQDAKDAVIFWGSQSGTAETLATRLAKECLARFNLQVLCADLADYDPDTIALIPNAKFAMFIISTYGEGDPSDNTSTFWDWLHQREQLIPRLESLRYVAFGLGNSNYRYFNRVIDVATDAFDKAGAQRLMSVGKADDAKGGTEEDFLGWKDSLFDLFRGTLRLTERDVIYKPSILVVQDESLSQSDLYLGEQDHHSVAHGESPVLPLVVASAHNPCPSSSQGYVHLELDLGTTGNLRYRTGDHLAVYPTNPDNEVQLLLKAIGYDEERSTTPILIQPVEEGHSIKIPSPTTLQALLRHYLEICAPVSRESLRQLAAYAPNAQSRKVLLSLADDKDAYASFLSNNHVNLGRILSITAPGLVWNLLPISYLVESLPVMRPRYYSISSSSAVSSHRVAITVGVVSTELSGNRSVTIPGITSSYLSKFCHALNSPVTMGPPVNAIGSKGYRIYASIRQSAFKLPMLSSIPLIMIAAGTGIAPFRAFILERARLHSVGQSVGGMLLFFGCRTQLDVLYKGELDHAAATLGDALEIVTAFSRETDSPKVYVQNRIAERQAQVCQMLEDRANVYVCGRVSMAKEVSKVLEDAMKSSKGWDDVDTKRWVENTKRGKKWLEDVWG